MNSTQCRRTVCSITSITSIQRSTPRVTVAQTVYPMKSWNIENRFKWCVRKGTYANDGAVCERARQEHVEKDFCQLTVGKREGPQTQVWGRVRNGAQSKFNCMNHWLDTNCHKIEFFVTPVPMTTLLASHSHEDILRLQWLIWAAIGFAVVNLTRHLLCYKITKEMSLSVL